MRGRGIGADVPRTVSELLWKLCTQGSIKGGRAAEENSLE